MAELSMTAHEKARKAVATVFQAMQEPGTGRALSVALGVSDATISRLKNEHLEDVLVLVYSLGFKLVESEMVAVDFNELKMLKRTYSQVADYERLHGVIFGNEEG